MSPSPACYTFMGAYWDSMEHPALLRRALPDVTSIQQCAVQCGRLSHAYNLIGIQYAGHCYCGSSVAEATKYGKYKDGCWGFERASFCNAVYQVTCFPPSPPPSPPPPSPPPPVPSPSPRSTDPECWEWLGSYWDSSAVPAMHHRASPDVNSIQQCAAQCLGMDPSFSVMALQYAGHCYCGSSIAEATKYGKHSHTCRGWEHTSLCSSVYQITCFPPSPPPSPSPPPPPSPPPLLSPPPPPHSRLHHQVQHKHHGVHHHLDEE